jgi:hypothetical protein
MDLQLAAGNLPGASQNSRDLGGLNTTKCDMRRNVTLRRKTDKTAWSILYWKLEVAKFGRRHLGIGTADAFSRRGWLCFHN